MSAAHRTAPQPVAQSEVAPKDFITVLHAHGGGRAAKHWRRFCDGDDAKFKTSGITLDEAPNIKHWVPEVLTIDDIADLSAALRELERLPDAVVIRGQYSADAHDAHVAASPGDPPNTVLRRKAFFTDVPHHWVLFDADSVACSIDPMQDPEGACSEFIADNLPPEFHGASYHWQVSGGAGHPTKAAPKAPHPGKPFSLRVHLWFWLEVPMTSADLKAWHAATRAPVDAALFDPIQIHYTANPTFAQGVTDPVPPRRRSGFVTGLIGDSVALTVAPTSSASPRTPAANDAGPVRDEFAEWLDAQDLVLGTTYRGHLIVKCPNDATHSTGAAGDTSTVYMPAGVGGPHGRFKCFHSGCTGLQTDEFQRTVGWPGAAPIPKALEGTDMANAKAFARDHAGFLLFDHGAGAWRTFEGGSWRACAAGEHVELFKKTTEALGRDIPRALAAGGDVKAAMAAVKRAASRVGADSALHLARSDPRLAAHGADFDRHPDVLNVLNGTVHLPTGLLMPHDPEQRLVRQCPVLFDPDAKCPLFMSFLRQISCGDPAWVESLQRVLGYSIGGDVSLEMLFMWLGTGANGKSVLANLVRAVLGDYVAVMPAAFLNRQVGASPNAPTPALVSLAGARIAQANETESGARLSAQTVKVAVSTEPVTARPMYGQPFTYSPTAKVHVRGNHKPRIEDTDEGIWRRLVLIPFDLKLQPHQRDPGLEAHLRQELPGILRWLVEGHLKWRRDGLALCERITEASAEYRRESDPVGEWLADRGELGAGFAVEQLAAYADFSAWARAAGVERIASATAVVEQLKQYGVRTRRPRGAPEGPRPRVLEGLRLRVDPGAGGPADV
jgi:putative DNA primase/helicase